MHSFKWRSLSALQDSAERHSSGCVRDAWFSGILFFFLHLVLSLLYAWLAQGCCPVFAAFSYNRYFKAEQNVLLCS